MTPIFKIFKLGITDFPITILVKNSELNDSIIELKKSKYIYLGYTIINL